MIQIDIPLPKSCFECPIKSVEEDYSSIEYFYWCPLLKVDIRGKKRHKQRFRKCPLKEVKELDNE